MIFVPTKNVREKWDIKDGEAEYIIWTYNEFVEIHYIHYKKDEFNSYVSEIHTEKEDDYNSKFLCTWHRFKLLNCPEICCQAEPQLRYNAIINKYYCICPSSMICTKNDDKDEIRYFKEMKIKFTQKNGFSSDPLKAICLWQRSMAKSYEYMAKEIESKFLDKVSD